MDIARTSDVWWKNAVFYCLDVETFQDGDGDGIGDFPGLTQRLDYLAGLGVTCLWLMPFYPSPNRDDGYDITDYYAVDPRLGSL
ncbi:MAG TPA: alpha-amylase family glycosyl hydrolase, partial [Geminicoccaceae bacterium]|nr:alpha-amylase family glycosyl hydrolase [Geminicoccaceae bacterium]